MKKQRDYNELRLVSCVLRLTRRNGRTTHTLTGLLEQVSLPDRERVAAALAAHLGLTHDEAYAHCWSEVPRPC